MEDNFIIQKLVTKESKWLVIHNHCIQNIDQIDQGEGNQQLCVSVINRHDEETKKNVFFPFL